ncbi:MAG: hypothetical protein R3C14_08355 [Caldilineaceae bacterium]
MTHLQLPKAQAQQPPFRRRIKPNTFWAILCTIVCVCLGAIGTPELMLGQEKAANGEAVFEASAPQVDWLEPRGLNVVDLIGLVPEDHLRDSILTYETGRGILQYESGSRNGNTVQLNVRGTPRFFVDNGVAFSKIGCPSQTATYDQWPSPVPASTLRVFDANGADITATAVQVILIQSGQVLPTRGAGGYMRYIEQPAVAVSFTGDGSIQLPANMGCVVILRGRYTTFKARFTFTVAQKIQVAALGSESFTFHSYIGVGGAGTLSALSAQMGRYGNRHDKFTLNAPVQTEYIWVKFPPTPIDPYAGDDAITYSLPGSGTYRVARSDNTLSVDHLNSMGLPLHGQWQDVDQHGGEFLSFFSDGQRISSPEYFLPAGVPYDPCMTNGGCSDSLLDTIYHTTMTMTVYYYKISRAVSGLQRIPLKQVGDAWGSRALAANDQEQHTALAPFATTIPRAGIYLPYVAMPLPTPTPEPTPTPSPTPQVEPDDSTGCPCGWFDGEGRMYDYIGPP